MNESIDTHLARLRESREPADQDFLKTFAAYSGSRDPHDAILPSPSNSFLFGLTSLARLAAAACPHDADALVLAEFALLNLDDRKIDHPFAEAFMSLALASDEACEQVLTALRRVAAGPGITEDVSPEFARETLLPVIREAIATEPPGEGARRAGRGAAGERR